MVNRIDLLVAVLTLRDILRITLCLINVWPPGLVLNTLVSLRKIISNSNSASNVPAIILDFFCLKRMGVIPFCSANSNNLVRSGSKLCKTINFAVYKSLYIGRDVIK